MTIREDLRAAWARIDEPDKLAQGAFATDEHGHACRPDDPAACRFCAWGAVIAARTITAIVIDGQAIDATTVLARIAWLKYGRSVESVNDQLGYDAVRHLYQTAITSGDPYLDEEAGVRLDEGYDLLSLVSPV